ncbi:MAG TPA: ABC transporter permease [Leptospiraceae bacterium]|nr:ABC transporter permease [Leptospiraceae bacterium]HMW04356.1 ABC transporter permease [Leptospiraceae bacterium]HMX31074.1 ABC transporter permease [Leptospiraceae bacterium]HMY31890.1 ABC transporter permease [Leptospiraceae bacterium]HMZ65248.1 ABC transporter permease [Leptospiraceae bacterium]
MEPITKTNLASFKTFRENESLILQIDGNLNISSTPEIWRETNKLLEETSFNKLIIEANGIQNCEGVGISLLFNYKRIANHKKKEFEIRGLNKKFESLLNLFTHEKEAKQLVNFYDNWGTTERIGFHTVLIWEEVKDIIIFIGECSVLLFRSLKNPKKIKWFDVFKISETSGVNALSIIILIGFLLGLIMSFQSAIPMQRFGAEIFVANLVSMSLFRELGPLMTAVIIAGRTASSFAAEIGTMKVSEEIDAIKTMGLSPLEFLVIPRLIAAIIISPMLTTFFNLAGLIGSAVVMMSFQYPFITFVNQVLSAVKNLDMLGGLFKATVFGSVIAAIGCYHGLNTSTGASSVGEATTRSVVNGIISIAILDGIFSVLFYYLGI